MRDITLENLTRVAAQTFAGGGDARREQLSAALVNHLHAFAREVQLSHEEWQQAIAFLHRCGDISGPERSEFTLLSDVLGLSSLVTHARPASSGWVEALIS